MQCGIMHAHPLIPTVQLRIAGFCHCARIKALLQHACTNRLTSTVPLSQQSVLALLLTLLFPCCTLSCSVLGWIWQGHKHLYNMHTLPLWLLPARYRRLLPVVPVHSLLHASGWQRCRSEQQQHHLV
jgi:hypothetical protein